MDREYLLSLLNSDFLGPKPKLSFSRTICFSLPVAYLVSRQMANMQPHSFDVIKDLFSQAHFCYIPPPFIFAISLLFIY